MRKLLTILVLAALLMVGCSRQPQTLNEVKSEFVTIDDSINVHYKIWNPNAELNTLCFIHGFGCDMNTWEKQFEAFRDDDVQLVFIDLPGYGKSDKPYVDYTFDFFAHAIDEVLNANNIKDAIFVGHSLGTPVCRHTLMTTDHSGAFVDVDGVYCFYDGTEMPEYIEAINQFGHAFDGPDCREVITGFVSSLAGKDTPQWVTDYAMSVMPETPQYVASSTMQHLVEPHWWHNTQLALPVMVICTQNSGLEPDNEQKMQALYPNLDYTELTTCGHFIHMEQAEIFNEKLKNFISNMKNKQGKAIGIGGVFFKAQNPDNTKQWYEDHLGIEKGDYGHIFTWYLDKNCKTEESTVWTPFEANTDYFGDNDMMVNYIVDDMDAIVERLRADGVRFVDDVTEYEGLGKFVHIEDNEARRVELWEPAK